MARTNKYTSINFNHIYDKNVSSAAPNPGSKPTSADLYKNQLTNPRRAHGRMLVLTRPISKSISTPPIPLSSPSLSPSPFTPPPPKQQNQNQNPDQRRPEPVTESDQISLRPLGRTGVSGSLSSAPVLGESKESEVNPVVVSPKPNRFVPPHLRPGFIGREERPGPVGSRGKESGNRQQREGYFVSPGRFGEDGRPKSGGQERMRRGGDSDLGLMNRPRSSGNRPSSSG